MPKRIREAYQAGSIDALNEMIAEVKILLSTADRQDEVFGLKKCLSIADWIKGEIPKRINK